MHLNPIVVLITDEDADTLRPVIAMLAHNFDTVPDDTARLMATNGWTPEMLAWSLMFRGIADAHRTGDLDFAVDVSNTETPDPDDTPD